MQDTRTHHRVSDRLEDRLPYYPQDPKNVAPFAKEVQRDEVTLAFGRRCIPKLVCLLENDELCDAKRIEALGLLRDATRSLERKSEAVEQGAIEACTRLLTSLSEEIKERAARVLGSLLSLRSARKRPSSPSSCLPALVHLLNDSVVSVREAASWAVSTFVSNSDGSEALCETPKLVSNLVRSVPDPDQSASVNIQVMDALEYITRQERGVELCLDAHGEDKLVELATLTYLSDQVASIARNLGARGPGKARVIEAGLVPILAGMLERPNEALRCAASSALLAISVMKAGKAALGAESVASILCSSLQDESPSVRLNVAEVIRSASELPDVHESLVRKLALDEEVLRDVFGSGCAAVLFSIVEEASSTPAHVETALKVLDSFVRGPSATSRDDVFQCLFSIEILAKSVASGEARVAELARGILDELCEKCGASALRRRTRAMSRHPSSTK